MKVIEAYIEDQRRGWTRSSEWKARLRTGRSSRLSPHVRVRVGFEPPYIRQ
jgi:hypothetical protein